MLTCLYEEPGKASNTLPPLLKTLFKACFSGRSRSNSNSSTTGLTPGSFPFSAFLDAVCPDPTCSFFSLGDNWIAFTNASFFVIDLWIGLAITSIGYKINAVVGTVLLPLL